MFDNNSKSMLDGWAADKRNDKTADEMFDAYINYYNACFQRPSDMHLGIHLCRGSVALPEYANPMRPFDGSES